MKGEWRHRPQEPVPYNNEATIKPTVPVLRDGILYLGDKPWDSNEQLKIFIREENQKLLEAIKQVLRKNI